MTAVFLTYSSNKVQMTLNDSNFPVNQKKVAVIRSSSYWEFRANNQKMREKLFFKKLKMTDYLWLQKTKKKVKNGHNQDEKLPFSLKVKEIDRWRLVKNYFKKVCFALQVFRLADKNKSISLHLLTILFFHANTREKIFHSPVNQHGHLVTW